MRRLSEIFEKVAKPEGSITLEEVKEVLLAIEKAGDPEGQHSWEDSLHIAVLQTISHTAYYETGIVEEALKTLDMDFPRWCA